MLVFAVAVADPDTDTATHTQRAGRLSWRGQLLLFCLWANGANLFAKPLLNEAAGKSQKGISCNQ